MPSNRENVRSISRIAGADFSGDNPGQYRFCKVSATQQTVGGVTIDAGCVVLAGNGERAIGVLSGKQFFGHAIEVSYSGREQVICGGAVTVGDKVQSDANGAAVTQSATGCVQGEAMESGASGEIISVLLDAQGAP